MGGVEEASRRKTLMVMDSHVKNLNTRQIEEELGGLLFTGQFSCETRAYNSGPWPAAKFPNQNLQAVLPKLLQEREYAILQADKVDWRKFTSASHATADDNLDLVRGIFSFYNLDMKVHNNYPVVEEQLAAGEDNEQDEDQEEPGLLARLWLRMTLTWGRRRR